jgi:hypothetical protein
MKYRSLNEMGGSCAKLKRYNAADLIWQLTFNSRMHCMKMSANCCKCWCSVLMVSVQSCDTLRFSIYSCIS